MRRAVVYAIRNKVTGKYYVGSTWDLEQRWDDHRKALAESAHTPKLQMAWDASGPNDWEWVVLEEGIPITNQFASEQHWIDALDAFENGYNSSRRAGSYVGVHRQGSDHIVRQEQRVLEMLQQIARRRPYREIAEEFGVSIGFLAKVKRTHAHFLAELIAAEAVKKQAARAASSALLTRKAMRVERERRVRTLIGEGRAYREIAMEVGCSLGTITNISHRMSARNAGTPRQRKL